MKDKKVKNSGIGFISALTLIFIVLKLTNNINWSWIWVLSPIWITVIFLIVIFTIIMIGGRTKKRKMVIHNLQFCNLLLM